MPLIKQRDKLLKDFRKNKNKYILLGIILVLLFLTILYLGPLEGLQKFGLISLKKGSEQPAKAAPPIELGVDAYKEHIASEPKGITYVYKYVVGQGWQTIVTDYINEAYKNNLKPVIVFYTNFDSSTPDLVAWDQVAGAITATGKETWVVVEPDMWGYIRNDGKCGTLGKQYVDRFTSSKPANAHLGFFMSPWNLPYVGAADDAADWKSCWTAAGGDKMEDIYVDVSDRDQEFKNSYPWPADKLNQFEDWFKAIQSATGKKVSVWQVPLGNSTCSNGRRSNFVETWLTDAKLSALSPSVSRFLFGPGIETGSDAQSWNLSNQDKYDCGFFNKRIGELFSGTGGGTSPTPAPSSSSAPTPASSPSGQTLSIFDENTGTDGQGYVTLDNNFKLNSWVVTPKITTARANSGSKSITTSLNNYGTVMFFNNNTFTASNYDRFEFYVYPPTPAKNFLVYSLYPGPNSLGNSVSVDKYAPITTQTNQWLKVSIPLADFKVGTTPLYGFALRDENWETNSKSFGDYYIDQVRLGSSAGPAPTPTIAPTPSPVPTPTPQPTSIVLEVEAMSLPSNSGRIVSEKQMSGGKGLLIWSNATATAKFITAASKLVVRARGDLCNGAPHMIVTIDGSQVLSVSVNSSKLADYSTSLNLAGGVHSIGVTFDNDYYAKCDRNLYVDKLTFSF